MMQTQQQYCQVGMRLHNQNFYLTTIICSSLMDDAVMDKTNGNLNVSRKKNPRPKLSVSINMR